MQSYPANLNCSCYNDAVPTQRKLLSLCAATTDVQSASAVFFESNIMLECVFAVGSSATGCLFVFTRLSGELAENVTVLYDGTQGGLYNTSCNQLSQTRCGQYDLLKHILHT